MTKIKRVRTLDCVVMGWRPGTTEGTVGSLILGLHDGGTLRPVGHCAGFTAARKRSLRAELALRDRRPRKRRGQPLGRRPRPGVGEAPARAGGRGELRPRQRRAHPARRPAAALPRRPRPGELHVRSARDVTGDQRHQGEQRAQRGGGERQGERVIDERRADQGPEQHGRDGGEAAQRPHGVMGDALRVRTVVVRSGKASLRTVELRMPIANPSTAITR